MPLSASKKKNLEDATCQFDLFEIKVSVECKQRFVLQKASQMIYKQKLESQCILLLHSLFFNVITEKPLLKRVAFGTSV